MSHDTLNVLPIVLVALALAVAGAGCHQPTTTTTSPTIPPEIAKTARTQRAAGEFVRSPRRIVLNGTEVRLALEMVTFTPTLVFRSADGTRHRMTLDTGADSVWLTPALVSAVRATTRPSNRTYRDASGSGALAVVAAVDRLDFGAVRFEDFDAAVGGLNVGSDALLGWPLWRDLLVTIDYPNHTLVLRRGALPEPDGKRILPLRVEHDRLMIQTVLDGRDTWLNIDTGWGAGDSLEMTAGRAAEMAWASPPVPIVGSTPMGKLTEKLGRLQGDLVLGRYRFVQPVAGTNEGISVDLLGAWALSNFAVTLDLRNLRAQFDRSTDEPIRTGPVAVAGFDCDLKSQPLKVTGVMPHSEAARAGLRVGDLLLTINGRPALEGFLSHGGDAYVIELKRGEQISILTVPMTKLVP